MNLVRERAEMMQRKREEQRAKCEGTQIAAPAKQSKRDYNSALKKWWNSLPPSVRQHPWSMDTIMAAAFPGENPAPRFVAVVLRDELGFFERRDWTRAGRNRRQWIPPAETK